MQVPAAGLPPQSQWSAIGQLDVPMGDAPVYVDRAGTPIGAAAGYATLDEAITAVEPLTALEAGGTTAAILEERGRFVARSVDVGATLARPSYHFGVVTPAERGFRLIDPSVAALVDGHRSAVRTAGSDYAPMPSSPIPLRQGDIALTVDKPWSFNPVLRADVPLSPGAGYASLDDAIAAMQELTRGPGSAVVYRDGDAFQARELLFDRNITDWEARSRFDAAPFAQQLRWDDASAVAVVDGDSVTLRPGL